MRDGIGGRAGQRDINARPPPFTSLDVARSIPVD
jgi:hypothetical protein